MVFETCGLVHPSATKFIAQLSNSVPTSWSPPPGSEWVHQPRGDLEPAERAAAWFRRVWTARLACALQKAVAHQVVRLIRSAGASFAPPSLISALAEEAEGAAARDVYFKSRD